MFNGSLPAGSSSAPSSGNTGMVCGRSGKRSAATAAPVAVTSGKQDRRERAAALEGRFVCRAQGLEDLQQFLARGILVPAAIAANDVNQMVDRSAGIAAPVER